MAYAYTQKIARQYSIGIKNSFNYIVSMSSKDREDFLNIVCDHMYREFNSNMSTVEYSYIEDENEFMTTLCRDIGEEIERYNEQLDEYTNDEPITGAYISHARVPGEVMNAWRKVKIEEQTLVGYLS